jgi:hypothetical protein
MAVTENFREAMNLFDDASTNVMKNCQYDELHENELRLAEMLFASSLVTTAISCLDHE